MKGFSIERAAKIYTYPEPVNMSCSFTGLRKIITNNLNKKAEVGDLFLFINKKRTYIKILFYAHDGFCIFAKKLDKAFFREPTKTQLTIGELWKIVDNVVLNYGIKE
jgi:transposase